mmetsp:Transcript_2546/g.3903  ORF Transcript_2546/g.3903 Transcript_2546/m.3903 type:complete len:382 (-) Transcript_2546:179-1324(-)
MIPPTTTQQYALAYAPKPFAAMSFLSSCYMIYYLVFKEPEKLQRLYHRLVLAMNVALLPPSFAFFWGSWAMPRGTPHKIGAVGTVDTCTAQGFIATMFGMTVSIYYGSLVVQAFLGVKNNFKEEKYGFIEKWVHATAYIVPCAITAVFAVTENFNPNGSVCWAGKAPQGCETDPYVDCQRGQDIGKLETIVGLFVISLYLFFPLSVVIAMCLWIKKSEKKILRSNGLQAVRESARKEMMHSIAKQISMYLVSFWSTSLLVYVGTGYEFATNKHLWNLTILGNVVFSTQGLVLAVVYFILQRIGRVKHIAISPLSRNIDVTVEDIRANAERKASAPQSANVAGERRSVRFSIFDGIPDENSPWAKYLLDDLDEEVDGLEHQG